MRFLHGQDMKLSSQKSRKNTITDYLVVNLRKNGESSVCMVYQLVAKHFIPNPNNYPVINHKDGDKTNNHVENLEWCTYADNNVHALRTGLRNPRGRAVIQYDGEMNVINEYISVTEASRQTNIGRSSISNCLNNRAENAGGFIWKYKDIIHEGQTTNIVETQKTAEDEQPLVAQDIFK